MLRADSELWKALSVERRVWYIRQGKLFLLKSITNSFSPSHPLKNNLSPWISILDP